MNAKDLTRVLTRTFEAKQPDITEGPSGIGKTEIKHQVARQLGMDSLLLHPATLDQVDLGGYPLTIEHNGTKRIARCFDDLLASVFDAKVPTLLHIDEVGQADNPVQKAIAPFVSPERRINNMQLPDCVAVSLSTNSAVHRTGSVPILVHIRSRVATTLHLEPHLDSFLDKAAADHIHPHIMSFLKHNPSMLYELEMLPAKQLQERGLTYDKVFTSGVGYTCPRAWYRVSELLASKIPADLEQEVFTGSIGEVAARLFTTHAQHARQNLDVDAIVNHGAKWKFPSEKDPGLRWAFTYEVAALANKDTLGRVFEIANDLHKQGHSEYGMLVGQQTVTRENFMSHPEFGLFMKSPLGKMIMGVRL